MKNNYFSRLENKFYFKISRTVWHIIVGFAVLTLLSGIFLALWSFVPVFKETVTKAIYPTKEAYPKEITISPRELDALVNPPEKEKQPKETKDPQKVTYSKPKDTLGLALYELYLDSLQKVNVQSLTYKLNKVYNKTQIKKYPKKTKLLKAYILATNSFTNKKQVSLLNTLLNYPKNSISENVTLSELLTATCNEVNGNKLSEILNALGYFSRNNPSEGFEFIKFINRNIGKFEQENTLLMVQHFANLHNMRYNNKINEMLNIANSFFSMLTPYNGKKQIIALDFYFDLYRQKDQRRDNEIAGIERNYRDIVNTIEAQYNADLVRVESTYQSKKSNKRSKRMKALYGIGSGIATIAIFSIILVLFSLQRLIRRIGEQLDRLSGVEGFSEKDNVNTKSTSNQNTDETLFE